MTTKEVIEILNLCIASNIEVDFFESKIENGHKIKFPGDPLPVVSYNAALSKINALTLTSKKAEAVNN